MTSIRNVFQEDFACTSHCRSPTDSRVRCSCVPRAAVLKDKYRNNYQNILVSDERRRLGCPSWRSAIWSSSTPRPLFGEFLRLLTLLTVNSSSSAALSTPPYEAPPALYSARYLAKGLLLPFDVPRVPCDVLPCMLNRNEGGPLMCHWGTGCTTI
jgi:hypothetical protein